MHANVWLAEWDPVNDNFSNQLLHTVALEQSESLQDINEDIW